MAQVADDGDISSCDEAEAGGDDDRDSLDDEIDRRRRREAAGGEQKRREVGTRRRKKTVGAVRAASKKSLESATEQQQQQPPQPTKQRGNPKGRTDNNRVTLSVLLPTSDVQDPTPVIPQRPHQRRDSKANQQEVPTLLSEASPQGQADDLPNVPYTKKTYQLDPPRGVTELKQKEKLMMKQPGPAKQLRQMDDAASTRKQPKPPGSGRSRTSKGAPGKSVKASPRQETSAPSTADAKAAPADPDQDGKASAGAQDESQTSVVEEEMQPEDLEDAEDNG